MHVASFHQNEATKIIQAIPVRNFFIEDSLFMVLFLCVQGSEIRFSGCSEAGELQFSVIVSVS